MDKFIPYEKLSKKQRREMNALRREMWAIARSPASLRIRKRIADRRHGNGSMTIQILCLLFFHKERHALLHAGPR